MLRFAHLKPLRRSPVWLLAVGLFAVAMQALGGGGIMPRSSAGGGFQTEICTSRGVGKAGPAQQPGGTSQPDSGHQDCCRLCVASAPLLLADAALGVLPAPIYRGIFLADSFPSPSTVARLSHPPRGPPAI